MKRLFKFLGFLLFLIVIAAIGLGVYVAVSVMDDSDRTPECVREANLSVEQVVNRAVTQGLTAETEEIAIQFNEQEMNELLYAVVTEIDLDAVELKGAYVAYTDSGMEVEIPLSAFGMNTCLKGVLKAEYKDQTFSLQLVNGKVGNFEVTSPVIKSAISLLNLSKQVETAIAESGLPFNVNLDTMSVSITADAAVNVLVDAAEDEATGELISLLGELCFKEGLTDFNFGGNGEYGVILGADRLQYDQATDGEISHPLQATFTAAAERTEGKLSETVTVENVAAVFNYNVLGYNGLGDEDKAKIDALGYDKTYRGLKPDQTPTTVMDIMLGQRSAISPISGVTFTLTDTQLENVLYTMDFLGMGSAFTDGEKVAYIAVESLGMEITDDALTVTLVLNAHGRRLSLVLDATCPPTDNTALQTTVTGVRLGGTQLQQKYIKSAIAYLDEALEEEEWIYATEGVERGLTLDLGKVVDGSTELSAALQVFGESNIAMKEEGGGAIYLNYRLSIPSF
ncbi:MAG: hypothetical protein J6Z36_04935 [Clostridia bacterium]|nr:hypothetical protein [Clostridia bacterium]